MANLLIERSCANNFTCLCRCEALCVSQVCTVHRSHFFAQISQGLLNPARPPMSFKSFPKASQTALHPPTFRPGQACVFGHAFSPPKNVFQRHSKSIPKTHSKRIPKTQPIWSAGHLRRKTHTENGTRAKRRSKRIPAPGSTA